MQNIEEIYQQYSKSVYKYLFCLTHNADQAEELTQETFYIAVQKAHHFRGDCKIYVWLCQIAKHLVYKEYKKNNKMENIQGKILPIEEENLEEFLIAKEEKQVLFKRIQELEPIAQKVIKLRIEGELSFKEIGQILNKTETWARIVFYRSKEKMKGVDKNG